MTSPPAGTSPAGVSPSTASTAGADAAFSFRLAWRLAMREMRGGLKGFKILLACLALGVFAIAAAGSTQEAIESGLSDDAQALLGGDLEARFSYRGLSPEQRAVMEAEGTLSHVREMRAMARAGDQRALVELKAVDDAYPLYGQFLLSPRQSLDAAIARQPGDSFGAVVEPTLANRLGLSVGDRFQVGDQTFILSGIIEEEPDRIASVFAFGPRLMVSQEALDATGLVQPGSLVRDFAKLRIETGTPGNVLQERLEAQFPESPWRLRTISEATPGLDRFLGNITLFLTLVGLTSLLVGGIGVANAVKAYIDGRAETIATLKCLGAPDTLVFRTYLVQIGLLALAGIACGMLLGALAPILAAPLLAELLPAAPRIGLYAQPMAEAAAFGALTAAVFGLWPLARTRDVPGAALFRGVVGTSSGGWPRGTVALVIAASALALAAMTVLTADRRDVALGFVVGAVIALGLFRLAAKGVMILARKPDASGRPSLRLGLANLHRPGAPTPSVVLSLGLGLTVLVAIALIEGNLRVQIGERMPAVAPAFFYIDIQPDQLETFEKTVAATPDAQVVRKADMIRGRIVALKGQPIDINEVDPDVRWAVQGDRGLTTAAELPPDARIIAGEWWGADYSGPPLLSVASDIAKGLGIGVGDSVTINILGREITGTVANLREVDWGTLAMNFAFIVSPGTLEGAPRTWIATVAAPEAAEDTVERAVGDALPNVSAIRVRQALETVQGILEAAGQAVRVTATVTLLAGALVLAGAIAAGQRRRIYDAVVLKVVGAARADILRAYLFEYGVLGAATGLIAAGVGTVAAWAVLRFVMRADWVFLPGIVAGVVAACVALTMAGGFFGTWRALTAKAAPLLRNE